MKNLKEHKESLKELRESVEQAIDTYAYSMNPCEHCEYEDKSKRENLETCVGCCFYHASRFKLRKK